MHFAILAEDAPKSLALRKQTRDAHLERLRLLADEGRLLVAGPHPAIATEAHTDEGFTGSLVIAVFENEGSAKQWAENDPYLLAGVYKSVSVKPFIPVLP